MSLKWSFSHSLVHVSHLLSNEPMHSCNMPFTSLNHLAQCSDFNNKTSIWVVMWISHANQPINHQESLKCEHRMSSLEPYYGFRFDCLTLYLGICQAWEIICLANITTKITTFSPVRILGLLLSISKSHLYWIRRG